MTNNNKIYFDVEVNQEKLDKTILYLDKITAKVEHLKELGVSKRRINKLFNDLIKIIVK